MCVPPGSCAERDLQEQLRKIRASVSKLHKALSNVKTTPTCEGYTEGQHECTGFIEHHIWYIYHLDRTHTLMSHIRMQCYSKTLVISNAFFRLAHLCLSYVCAFLSSVLPCIFTLGHSSRRVHWVSLVGCRRPEISKHWC